MFRLSSDHIETCILIFLLFKKRLDAVVVLAKPKCMPEEAHSYAWLLACNTTHLSKDMAYISAYALLISALLPRQTGWASASMWIRSRAAAFQAMRLASK